MALHGCWIFYHEATNLYPAKASFACGLDRDTTEFTFIKALLYSEKPSGATG
jgi:hypothetical protein